MYIVWCDRYASASYSFDAHQKKMPPQTTIRDKSYQIYVVAGNVSCLPRTSIFTFTYTIYGWSIGNVRRSPLRFLCIEKSHYLLVQDGGVRTTIKCAQRESSPERLHRAVWVLCKTYVSLKIITKWLGGGLVGWFSDLCVFGVCVCERSLWATDRAWAARRRRFGRLAPVWRDSRVSSSSKVLRFRPLSHNRVRY